MKTWISTLVAALLGLAALQAQNFTPPVTITGTGTNPVNFEFRADGTFIAKGNSGVGSLLTTDQGAGTRLLWHPAKAAFRAGRATGSSWDDTNVGASSAAWGNSTTASGDSSTAMGSGTRAVGSRSTAMGTGSSALGEASASMGFYTSASGIGSTAMGVYTTASGILSFATGQSTSASGYASTAMGMQTQAQSYASFAIGKNNVGGGNPDVWVATDPVFEVGNGPGNTSRSNALTVYKNGTATFQGAVRVAPGGDIPMFTGN